MESSIRQTVQQLKEQSGCSTPENLLAMGGEMRFAAREITGKRVLDDIVEINLVSLETLTHDLLQRTTAQLATQFHLSLPDAESLGLALLSACLIARELRVARILIAEVNLRDGLVKEMSYDRSWTESIRDQIVQSAIQLGRKFHFDEPHARHVSQLAQSLFDQLQDLHGLSRRFLRVLNLAAILHEVGRYVSEQSYHKHSMYLIRNAEFFGISGRDVELVALVARYHRRASPQPRHDGYSSLNRENRVAVSKLASMLRIAIALDASRKQRVETIECSIVANQVHIRLPNVADVSLEKLELRRNGAELFQDIFGTKVVLVNA